MAARFVKPYVAALFATASSTEIATLLPVLESFAASLSKSEEARRFLSNPAVPREKKVALLEALTARARVTGLAQRLLGVLLANGRLLVAGEVVKGIQERLDRERNEVEARLVTPAPVGDAHAEKIRGALEARTGRSVRLERAVDPALLGGFVVRVGSEVYDASLAQRLRKTRQALHQGAEGHHG